MRRKATRFLRTRCLGWCVGGLVSLMIPASVFAHGFIESIVPPSAVRGGKTQLTLRGSNLHQAIGLWTTLSPAVVRATLVGESTAGQATFELDIADEAPLGLFGLRLATVDGLSNAHLFVIDDIAPHTEGAADDPDGDLDVDRPPELVTLPVAVGGIYRSEDQDTFAIEVEAGESVSFEVVGNRLGQDFDALVVIRDASGRQVVARDNDVGLFFDCRFAHTFEKAGRYTVQVRDARFQGNEHCTYLLRMGHFSPALVALPSTVRIGERTLLSFPQLGTDIVSYRAPADLKPGGFYYGLRRPSHDSSVWLPLLASVLPSSTETEPNDSTGDASAAVVPGVFHGVLSQDGDSDRFFFDMEKGEGLRFKVESKRLGSPADIAIDVIDPEGNVVARGDDTGLDEARFDFTAEKTGRFQLQVSEFTGFGGPEFVYRVEVRPDVPEMIFESGASRLAIPQGSRQPLPLRLERHQIEGDVTLRLRGAPEGMTLQKTVFPAGATELENAVLASAGTPLGIYTLQVVATSPVDGRELAVVARTQPLVDRVPSERGPHGEPFLFREDQRVLPPTLTDRLAVQVTPPSVWDFELDREELTLARFLEATYEIRVSRRAGYDGSIEFVARGGALDLDGMGRRPVLSQTPTVESGESGVIALLQSTVISAQELTHRVTVTGVGEDAGRKVFLTRTFRFNMRPAFEPEPLPGRIEAQPGVTRRVEVVANRVEPFTGAVNVSLSRVEGISAPPTIELPAGEDSVAFDLSLSKGMRPGTYQIHFSGRGQVGKFQETFGKKSLEIVVQPASSEN